MYGLDLLDVYRGELSARKVLSLVGRLPRDSAFFEAVLDDDAAVPDDGGSSGEVAHPPVSEWSPTVEILADVFDRLGDLVVAVHSTVPKRKAPKVKPRPRPQTAADRVAGPRRNRRVAELEATVFANDD